MTDIFGAMSQFILFAILYFSVRFSWKRSTRFAIGISLCAVFIGQFLFPMHFVVRSAVGKPLEMTLRLANLLVIILYVIHPVRARRRASAPEIDR
ncbi:MULTISPECIES: hypothetical protein [unclassified Novosphingobium]|uniref:hypothetical protein n=1 Tax=unclassified Novosphingobium TaxID=2644732 RepID=UPI00105ED986|nr:MULTISPECIES: hypothetical protein [unclassified Novosphingobium]